jgi:hypothetical protein
VAAGPPAQLAVGVPGAPVEFDRHAARVATPCRRCRCLLSRGLSWFGAA